MNACKCLGLNNTSLPGISECLTCPGFPGVGPFKLAINPDIEATWCILGDIFCTDIGNIYGKRAFIAIYGADRHIRKSVGVVRRTDNLLYHAVIIFI